MIAIPTAIYERTNPYDAARRKDEPQYPPCPIEPPVDLSPSERRYWDRMAPMLTGAGILKASDGVSFCRLCKMWALFFSAKDTSLLCRLDTQITRLEREFGLSAASRAHLDAVEPVQSAEDDEFFGG